MRQTKTPRLTAADIEPLMKAGKSYREIGKILAERHGRKMPYQPNSLGRVMHYHRLRKQTAQTFLGKFV
jgi:hypothetical protein